MNLQEARPFIAHFASGNYAPEEHAAFLDWLETASLEELDLLAAEYEAMHENWTLSAGPTVEWTRQLEERLDKLDQYKAPVRAMRPNRRFVWVAAASMAALAVGSFFWYSHKPEVLDIASVPKGGGLRQLVLADGSKVWLNSASTLRYPRRFNGAERMVELTGEGYFEIANNASMPFKVKAGAVQIDVLGTSFNVMAYEDEGFTKTSLMQGSVRVSKGAESRTLQAGDEAGIDAAGIHVSHSADAVYVLAWKNGFLNYDNASLQTVMRAIGRSYNVEIQYEGLSSGVTFSGKLPRNGDLKQVLHILGTQGINCRMEGKTIIVMP
ncbi:MAG: FecR domain-containing protein [Bacteroidota bacterium]|nr:FecR domain-containing protein [Bacteroidota bacterium]MDP4258170.1 FecR domain-containing protein [Bacteroidota bacterium]